MKKEVITDEQKRELSMLIEKKLNVSNTISIDELLASFAKSSVKKNED